MTIEELESCKPAVTFEEMEIEEIGGVKLTSVEL